MQFVTIFMLISCVSLGALTGILSTAFLKPKSAPVRWFLAFLGALFLLVLNDALLYYFRIISPGNAALRSFFMEASRVLFPAVAGLLYIFVRTVTGLRVNRPLERASTFTVFLLLIAGGAGGIYADLAVFPGSAALRRLDPADVLIYLTLAYSAALVIFRYRLIEDKPLSRALVRICVFTAAVIPAVILEDVLCLVYAQESVVLALPGWYIIFNGLLVYYGWKYVLVTRYSPASGPSEEETARRLSAFRLTTRELEITTLILHGHSNKEIGIRLFISPATVRNHIHHIFEKTGAPNRMGLARLCRQ